MLSFFAQHRNDMALYVRFRPLGSPPSIGLAAAVECAGRQNLFWEAIPVAFASRPASWRADFLSAIGASANGVQLRGCLDDKSWLPSVKGQTDWARDHGVKGTPTYALNGEVFQGGRGGQEVQDIISKQLLQASKQP
jgi:protein-disulfide isomerase